jgi:hypothetical protein
VPETPTIERAIGDRVVSRLAALGQKQGCDDRRRVVAKYVDHSLGVHEQLGNTRPKSARRDGTI